MVLNLYVPMLSGLKLIPQAIEKWDEVSSPF